MTPRRVVDTEDAFIWLPAHRRLGPVVAVLPDAAEIGLDPSDYPDWFVRAARACLDASTGPTVFVQTDRLTGGRWVDKSVLLHRAAGGDVDTLWHKVVLRRSPGAVDLHRPTWSHLIAFGPGRPGTRTPDVIRAGRSPWRNGIGVSVAMTIARYLAETAPGATVLNPFCGYGTVLAAANAVGLDAHGCDLDPGHAAQARTLTLAPQASSARSSASVSS